MNFRVLFNSRNIIIHNISQRNVMFTLTQSSVCVCWTRIGLWKQVACGSWILWWKLRTYRHNLTWLGPVTNKTRVKTSSELGVCCWGMRIRVYRRKENHNHAHRNLIPVKYGAHWKLLQIKPWIHVSCHAMG